MPATESVSSDVDAFRPVHQRLLAGLIERQNPTSGAWPYNRGQEAVEPTCLALLAIRSVPGAKRALAARWLFDEQTPSGGWNSFAGHDSDGCWTTSLAVLSLVNSYPASAVLRRAVRWLINTRGREAHWLRRWKFETIDKKVRFNPRKYGWSWVGDTTSWVVPTALAIIALEKAVRSGLCRDNEIRDRVRLGCEMLLDRMCPGGGWNTGNGVVFGVALEPHIDTTAVALLALRNYRGESAIEQSLRWLGPRAVRCPSPFSTAWAVLAMDAYRDLIPETKAGARATVQRLIGLLNLGSTLPRHAPRLWPRWRLKH
jgi:Prenyltransferase and squalene oxidase repeat